MKKYCVHCFLGNNGDKHFRINDKPEECGEDFVVGVDFKGEANKISADEFADIANYIIKHLESKNKTKLIIPKAGDVILLNRKQRRLLA